MRSRRSERSKELNAEQIAFLREGLSTITDGILESLQGAIARELAAHSRLECFFRKSWYIAKSVAKIAGRIIAEVLFLNAVSDNVTGGDFDIDINPYFAKIKNRRCGPLSALAVGAT